VAKGARKPGARISGKAELLNVNRLLLAKGKNLDIITQCENIESFSSLRTDLKRLTYALYYAELTQVFGQGLAEDCARYFDRLSLSLGLLAASSRDPALLCLEFEFALLDLLGIKPELNFCVGCRNALTESNLSAFNHELGGLVCQPCFHKMRVLAADGVKESSAEYGESNEETIRMGLASRAGKRAEAMEGQRANVYVTPLVWKRLVLARVGSEKIDMDVSGEAVIEGGALTRATMAARHIMQSYIEYKAGKRMRALDLIENLPA
jgi:recombinational DNA repair protein (RecF pathway)